ncbi:MAG TPA: DUF6765 family protein [Burkholderiales bacterium]|jgi:hypothetical protein
MNIDFHYGVIYVVGRLAGLSATDAETVAHSCQYIDDATIHGILDFRDGETFERFASAHALFDYQNAVNLGNDGNRLVWAPFHFLPAGEGRTLEDKAVCRPDSRIARETVRAAIRAGRDGEANALHRLGVTLHTYVDTWAHQGFSGIDSAYNSITSLTSDEHDHEGWVQALEAAGRHILDAAESRVLSQMLPLGHGAALTYPDRPWAKWSYVNGHGMQVTRDNLPDFVTAAQMAHRAVRGFINGHADFENENGLPEDAARALHGLLGSQRDTDGVKRLAAWSAAIARGDFGAIGPLPPYLASGVGSWKHRATGITAAGDDGDEKPQWTPAFETSDYRKFHDAVKEHRFEVTQRILPAAGVRLA